MEIFISWSGTRGEALAKSLGKWLPKVVQSLKPWVSASDIEKGARWLKEISEKLDKTNFGILCLTPENINEPWILFEAGALSKALGTASVCPILFGFSPSELAGPLSQFQATKLDQEDMLKLLQTINKALGPDALKDGQLKEAFNLWWPKLEEEVAGIPPFATKSAKKRPERDILEEILKVVRRLEVQTPPTQAEISLSNITRKVLATLTPREEIVLRMLFGIGNDVHKISEISNKFESPEEEIQQTIETAFRKLRHPSRAKYMKKNSTKTDSDT